MGILYVIDESGEEKPVSYKPYEYRNLMDLLLNELWEDWGDCRGRAMCGTCHIEILEGIMGEMDEFELHTLNGLPNKTASSRLACQIMVNETINNMRFRILRDY